MKKSILFGVVLACSMLMTACGADEAEVTNTEKATATEKNNVVETVKTVNETDVWTGFKVEYAGIEPNGKLEFEYTIDDYVQRDVMYTADKTEGLSNGDVITITAEFKPNALVDTNTFVITEPTKTFTVSGLKSYLKTTDGYDMTTVDNILNEKLDETLGYNERKFGIGNGTVGWLHGYVYFDDVNELNNPSYDHWSIKERDIVAEKNILFYNEETDENTYVVFWNLQPTIEKIDYHMDGFFDDSDKYNVGDILNTDLYIATYITNVLVNSDGTFDTENSYIGSTSGEGIGGEYNVKTLDEMIDSFLVQFEGYTVIE